MTKLNNSVCLPNKTDNENVNNLKDNISIVSNIVEILTFLCGAIFVLYCSSIYLYNGAYFYYWNIDMDFYVQDSGIIINGLLYSLFLVCILILFFNALYPGRVVEENRVKVIFKNSFLFIIFTVISFLFSKNNFFRYGVSLYSIFCFVVASFGIFMLIRYYASRFDEIIYDIRQNFSNIFQFIFVLFISICTTAIILGFLNSFLKRDYSIIINDVGMPQVILYSTKEYYIAADCRIDGKKMIVFDDTQRKVDNYNVQLKKYNFLSVEKEQFYKD